MKQKIEGAIKKRKVIMAIMEIILIHVVFLYG